MAILDKWNREDKIVFIGDLISRGEHSIEVVRTVMNLVQKEQAVCIMGNHEYTLIEALRGNLNFIPYIYNEKVGAPTLKSFLKEISEDYNIENEDNSYRFYITDLIKKNFKDELQFIINLPLYYKHGKYLFTHAGVDNTIENIEEMHYIDIITGDIEKCMKPHLLNEIVVFGHMPTYNMGAKNSLYLGPHKIGIDGGGCFTNEEGSSINACIIDTSDTKGDIINYRFLTKERKLITEKICREIKDFY